MGLSAKQFEDRDGSLRIHRPNPAPPVSAGPHASVSLLASPPAVALHGQANLSSHPLVVSAYGSDLVYPPTAPTEDTSAGWRALTRELLSESSTPALVIDDVGIVWVINPAFCREFRVLPEEVEGRYLSEGVLGRWTKLFQNRLTEMGRAGSTRPEWRLSADSVCGTVVDFLVKFRPVRGPQSKTTLVASFARVGRNGWGPDHTARDPLAVLPVALQATQRVAVVWEYSISQAGERGALHSAYELPLGYPAGGTEPLDLWAIVHEDDREATRQALQGSELATAWTFRLRNGDGQWRWFQAQGQVTHRALDGTLLRAAGVALDVHRLKESERQLELTQSSVDRARDLILWVDETGAIAYANDAACRKMAATRLELSRRNVRDLFVPCGDPNGGGEPHWGTSRLDPSRLDPSRLDQPPAHGARPAGAASDYPTGQDNPSHVTWLRLWDRLITTGGCSAELDLLSAHGRRIPVRLHLNRIAHGGRDYAFAFMEDVSEQRAARRRLRENRCILNLAQQVANLGVLRWDRTQGTVSLSTRLRRILGIPESTEVRAREVLRCVHREDRQRLLTRIRETVWDGHTAPLDCRLVQSDGSLRFAYGVLQLEARQGTRPHSLIGVIQDVTDRKLADEQLQQHQRNLAHSTRIHTMGEMVAGIAHELAQPLCAISNFSSACETLLEREIKVNPQNNLAQILPWLQAVGSESRRAGKIIDRLRSYVRGTEPHRSTHEMRDLIQYAVDLLTMEARARRIEVRFLASNPTCKVVVDSVQIQQVLVNLVRNAFDAVDEVSQPIVRIVTLMTNDTVRIDVSDNGRGVPGDLDRIFEPFVTTKQEGMGMGLAISRTIVNQHGGRIWATRNHPKGLTFHILLPRTAKEW